MGYNLSEKDELDIICWARRFELDRVILFGSRARGDNWEKSDVDLAVSVAHAGSVDPETSHSTIEMRAVIVNYNLELFNLKNVTVKKSHAFIKGTRGEYTVHLGSGVVHMTGVHQINVLPVHSQHRGPIFLPFLDEDPKTAEILAKIILFAEDQKIKDPYILDQMN